AVVVSRARRLGSLVGEVLAVNGGAGIPLPSRSLVRPPVHERVSARAANPSLGSAGADETEPDPPQAVAVVPLLVDTQNYSAYGDAVGHAASVRDWIHESRLCAEDEKWGAAVYALSMARPELTE